MMLWISNREPPSCSSSLRYRLSSYAASDLVGETSEVDLVWPCLDAEDAVLDGDCEDVGVFGVGSTYKPAGFTASKPSEAVEWTCWEAGLIVAAEEVMMSGGSSAAPLPGRASAAAGSAAWVGAAAGPSRSIRFSGLLLRGISSSRELSLFSGIFWSLASPSRAFPWPSSMFTKFWTWSLLAEVAFGVVEGSGEDMQGVALEGLGYKESRG